MYDDDVLLVSISQNAIDETANFRVGTVLDVDTVAGTIHVELAGTRIHDVPYDASITPIVGEVVWLIQQGTSLLAVGAPASSGQENIVGSGTFVSDVEPTTAKEGDFWIDTTIGNLRHEMAIFQWGAHATLWTGTGAVVDTLTDKAKPVYYIPGPGIIKIFFSGIIVPSVASTSNYVKLVLSPVSDAPDFQDVSQWGDGRVPTTNTNGQNVCLQSVYQCTGSGVMTLKLQQAATSGITFKIQYSNIYIEYIPFAGLSAVTI
jgi:hypothetical protein